MGRLGGFRYREVVRRLTALGCSFDRQGHGSHEMWLNANAGRRFPLTRHAKPMKEGTLRAVLREAAIDVEDFLKA